MKQKFNSCRNRIFAYQILSLTNTCNLRCTYCDWQKEYSFQLTKENLTAAEKNLKASRAFADKAFGDFLMAVFSGGEPMLFPEILELFLENYSDKWVRISTNGLFDSSIILPILAKHKRLILTASLDGIDMFDNRARFTKRSQLAKVIKNIFAALDEGNLMMILCTINKYNIDGFFDFTKQIYEMYRPYFDCGRIVMPAHYITAYTNPIGLPSKSQEEKFLERLEEEISFNPLLVAVDWHYKSLISYVKNKNHNDCQVERWSRCAHFLGNEMIETGVMHSYICPMRGYGDMGDFNIHNIPKDFADRYDSLYDHVYKGGRCSCFVDWTAFDAVLKGQVSLERAATWFEFFRDERTISWISRFKNSKEA